MEIRYLTDDFAVSPQVNPEDMAKLASAGFTRVICNRPDPEIGPDQCAAAVKSAAQAAGLEWIENIILGAGMTMDNVVAQGEHSTGAAGPVFAYCRSGTRSATAWALSQAGKMPTGDIIALAAAAGYDLTKMRDQIDALAASAG